MPAETSFAADSAGRTARLGALEPSSEEQALLAAVLAKDRKAAAEFVARYADAVYAYVSRRLVTAWCARGPTVEASPSS